MSLTRKQSAWVKPHQRLKRSAFFNNKCVILSNFNHWLVGIIDGDGTFYFAKNKNGSWTFSFQISQSMCNLRLLYFIKSKLKVGSIYMDRKNSIATYRIRNRTHIIKYIIPIFDTHKLLTNKYYKYYFFKKAILIANNAKLTGTEKNLLVSDLKLKSTQLPKNFISPAWIDVLPQLKYKIDAEKIMKKAWLIGFTEAEGSFYITKKDQKRLVHGFEITQKLNTIVLTAIALIFNLKVTKKKTHFSVVTTNSKRIKNIINYFFKTMKGMKSLEFKIWAKSFNKKKRGFEYLLKIRNLMRNIRSIKLTKTNKK